MENEFIISVALISYNQENYVQKALESILKQKTGFKYEVLISDDASSDNTAVILKNICKHNTNNNAVIRLLCRNENVGATTNAYEILKRAKGKYIASLEGDDYWVDECFLQRQVDFLEEHDEYIGVQDKCIVVDKDGNPIQDKNTGKGTDFWIYNKSIYGIEDLEEWKMPGHISALVYRNIYMDKTNKGYLLKKYHGVVGDKTILMLLVSKGNIYCTGRVSMNYRFVTVKTANNWMSEKNEAMRRYDEYKMIFRIENFFKSEGFNTNMEKLKHSKIAAIAIIFMQKPNRYRFKTMMKIILYRKRPISDLLIAINAIIQKLYWKMKGQPDHRVSV